MPRSEEYLEVMGELFGLGENSFFMVPVVGAIVTKDGGDYQVAAGVPAKVVKI